MKFGMNVLQVNMHRLMMSDFLFDVTHSRWRPLRHFTQKKVLPLGEYKHEVIYMYPVAMQQRLSVSGL